MTFIEYNTWEEQTDICYKIIYNSKVDIIKVFKNPEGTKWVDNLKGSVYLTSIKFPTWSDAFHYLKRFQDSSSLEINLKIKIQEYIKTFPINYSHILDYDYD